MFKTIISEQAAFPSRLVNESHPDGIELRRINWTIFGKLTQWKSGDTMVSDEASCSDLPVIGLLVGELQEPVFIHPPPRRQHLRVKVVEAEGLSCKIICCWWCRC